MRLLIDFFAEIDSKSGYAYKYTSDTQYPQTSISQHFMQYKIFDIEIMGGGEKPFFSHPVMVKILHIAIGWTDI